MTPGMRAAAVAVAAVISFGRVAQAQGGSAAARIMFVNDEWEHYARVLQLSGEVPPYPWSVRGFSLPQMALLTPADSGHPWAAARRGSVWKERGVSVASVPAQLASVYNSAFPFGYNDGAVWAGRGLTTSAQGGAAIAAGPLSVVFAPVMFRAENGAFTLHDNGQSGVYRYGAAFFAHKIDQPQRFGDRPYARFDLGNSSAQVDLGPAAFGISNAPMHWGPARDHPILLGNNAPGFTHVYVGSSHPLDLKLLKVHGRMLWGKLYETPYVAIHVNRPTRFATGLVGVITPSGAPGLEIGGGRFFHVLWGPDVLSSENFTLPFGGFLLPNTDPRTALPENQLGSVFARWTFPRAGFEVYGELGRDDYSANLRDFELEPDQNSAYLVGFQRVLGRGERIRNVIRGELLNSRTSGLVLKREQTQWYTHLPVAQGHTNLGQALGSIGTFGGGASTLAFDRYSPAGRWTVSWSRLMRAEDIAYPSGTTNPQHADVQHALAMSGVRFRGPLALSWEMTYVRELNRDLTHDASNLRISTGVEYVW